MNALPDLRHPEAKRSRPGRVPTVNSQTVYDAVMILRRQGLQVERTRDGAHKVDGKRVDTLSLLALAGGAA